MVERQGLAEQYLYDEVFPTVGEKLTRMGVERPEGGKRIPVDCVAFGYAYEGIDEADKIASYHFSACLHPERGERDDCLLVREGEEGIITRVKNGKCELRVKKGRKGSEELENAI